MANSPPGSQSDLVSQKGVSWDHCSSRVIWQTYPVTCHVNASCTLMMLNSIATLIAVQIVPRYNPIWTASVPAAWTKTWRLNLNAAKCKTISFTLRTSPVVHTYTIEGQGLEMCDQVRDLGVVLDRKLTFAAHVDSTVNKANRMLSMLMRSVQIPACPRRVRLNHVALISGFNAHVRSIIEYGSVI